MAESTGKDPEQTVLRSYTLDQIVELWPIAEALARFLPVGDLITLSRTTTSLRSTLHGFGRPRDLYAPEDPRSVRLSLYIGQHQTSYWEALKSIAPFLCVSATHTKGGTPRPCRYCSKPICEACIVKSSFKNPNEHTFRNRCRYFCPSCWRKGNSSKRSKLGSYSFERARMQAEIISSEDADVCNCTNKKDGWVCLECKDIQNRESVEEGSKICAGQGCSETLGLDKEMRKMCLWCDKPLPRARAPGEAGLAYTKQIIEARARNAASRRADIEEYNRKRQKLQKMSRREMRGDDAVAGQDDADVPQFVRHLDTVNYQRFMRRKDAPDGDLVYSSKMGKWKYNLKFLLTFRNKCNKVEVETLTGITCNRFARTNRVKYQQYQQSFIKWSIDTKESGHRWIDLMATLQNFHATGMSFAELSNSMLQDYDFQTTEQECKVVLEMWSRTYPYSALPLETNHSDLVLAQSMLSDLAAGPIRNSRPEADDHALGKTTSIPVVSTANNNMETISGMSGEVMIPNSQSPQYESETSSTELARLEQPPSYYP